MTPIYFPHTYIPETVVKAVYSYFRPFTVYTPSQGIVPQSMCEWQQKGLIEILVPSNGEGERLLLLLKDFHNWATLHGHDHFSGFDYFKSQMDVVPFFDDTSVTQILADIKSETSNDTATSEARYFSARFFLSIAQEMDAKNDSLAIDMRRHQDLEKKLFSELTGDDDPASSQIGPVVSDTSARMDYMMAERLNAWWLLVSGVTKQNGGYLPAVFITTSRPAIDYLMDVTPEAQKIITLEGGPAVVLNEGMDKYWNGELRERLRLLASTEPNLEIISNMDWPAAPKYDHKTTQLKLTIYLIPGKSPSVFFNSTICQTGISDDERETSSRTQNTVLALIEV